MTRDQAIKGESGACLCEASRRESTTARAVVKGDGGSEAVVVCERC
jgi:hypothetical protein